MAQTLHAAGHVPDPAAIHTAREALADALAGQLAAALPGLIDSLGSVGPYRPDAAPAGRRALRLAALALLSRRDGGSTAAALHAKASNMTDQIGTLACLLDRGQGQPELAAFAARWQGDRLVMDKWFGLQITTAAPEAAAAITEALTRRADFDWKNPNRFRAVFGALAANHAGFHHAAGAAYRLTADWLIRLDPLNPQTAARLSTAFETWARYDADRQQMIRTELSRIKATPGLSRDLGEMAGRMLG